MDPRIMLWIVAPLVGLLVGISVTSPFGLWPLGAVFGAAAAWVGYLVWWELVGKR